jgi:predicted dehydrogenase
MQTLNFGSLGIASIHAYGFTPIIKNVAGLSFHAVASRDKAKADAYAAEHGIARAYGSYEELLDDPDVHCVYIALPNALHADWCVKALRAGKHVLCEKPLTANLAQAQRVAAAVEETGLVFAEAFHYRYHPLAKKLEDLVRGGAIGRVQYVSARFCEKLPHPDKPQYDPALAGGALMDVGCYAVNLVRWLAGCDEAEVVSADCAMLPSGVDGYTRATMRFSNGAGARVSCSITHDKPQYCCVRGTRGAIFVWYPFNPTRDAGPLHLNQYLFLVRRGARVDNIRVPKIRTYSCQLQEFRDAVLGNEQPATHIGEALANMKLIDAIFAKAHVQRPDFD